MLRIDNSPNPTGYPTGTATTDNFSVDIYVTSEGNWLNLVAPDPISTVSGSIDFCITYDADDITGMKFMIAGTAADAFWIDEWYLLDYSGYNCTGSYTEQAHYGTDNQVGYCMSTDPLDYQGNDPIVCSLAGVDDYETNGNGVSKSMLQWNL